MSERNPIAVAVAQLPMADTLAANLASARIAVAQAAGLGADLVVLPECATTGFHRGLRELCEPGALDDAVLTLQSDVNQHGVVAVVGTPLFDGPLVRNAAITLRPGRAPVVAHKVGLTASEAGFFTPGERGAPWVVGDWRFGVILCREILDKADVLRDFQGAIDVLLWPGYISWDQPGGAGEDYLAVAKELARTLGVHLLQCNWPHAINDPSLRGMGGSVWLDPAGVLIRRAPADVPSMTLLTLR